jgi:hypothetical protein
MSHEERTEIIVEFVHTCMYGIQFGFLSDTLVSFGLEQHGAFGATIPVQASDFYGTKRKTSVCELDCDLN